MKQFKSAIDEVRANPIYSDLKCLIFQKKSKKLKTIGPNDYEYHKLAEKSEPLTSYESVDSESPSYLFVSYILENSHPEFSNSEINDIKITDVNLCRPTGGLAVGLVHSMKKHLGFIDQNDCLGFTGSLTSQLGIGYNLIGPLLVGSQSLIIEHPVSTFESLKESMSLSKTTTLIIDSATLQQ